MSADLCTDLTRWPTASDALLLGDELFPDGYDEARGGPGEEQKFFLVDEIGPASMEDEGMSDDEDDLSDLGAADPLTLLIAQEEEEKEYLDYLDLPEPLPDQAFDDDPSARYDEHDVVLPGALLLSPRVTHRFNDLFSRRDYRQFFRANLREYNHRKHSKQIAGRRSAIIRDAVVVVDDFDPVDWYGIQILDDYGDILCVYHPNPPVHLRQLR